MTEDELNALVDEKGVMVKAIDIKPYHYALPCQIEGGHFMLNEMCCRKWSEDGTKIWWLLDTHNTYSAEPDKLIEVVPTESEYRTKERLEKMDAEDDEKMAKRPIPAGGIAKCDDPSVSPGKR